MQPIQTPWYIYFYLGIIFFQSVFIIYQYYIYRRIEYVYYLLYIIAISIYQVFLTTTVFNPLKFTITDDNLFTINRGVALLCFYFYFKFGEYFCNMDQKYTAVTKVLRWVQKIVLVIGIADIISAGITHRYFINEPLFFFCTGILILYSLYLVLFLVRQKDILANILVLGTLFLLTGTTFSILYMKISGRPHYETIWLTYIGVVVEFLFLNFGLILKSKFAYESNLNNTIISQQELFKERDRITADLHDEIGGGLSTIRILSDIHKDINDLETHKRFALKIAEISEDLSQKMRTIIWTLKPENDELYNFVTYINEHAKSIFDNTTIVFTFTESNLNKHLVLKNTARKNIFLCVKEALTNILKHAQASTVHINIEMGKSRTLLIRITDNGVGFTPSNTYGNGLRIMEKRMREINGTFHVESHLNTTTVLLTAVL